MPHISFGNVGCGEYVEQMAFDDDNTAGSLDRVRRLARSTALELLAMSIKHRPSSYIELWGDAATHRAPETKCPCQ